MAGFQVITEGSSNLGRELAKPTAFYGLRGRGRWVRCLASGFAVGI